MNYQHVMREWNEIFKRVSDLDRTASLLKTDMLKLRGAVEEENERRFNEAVERESQQEEDGVEIKVQCDARTGARIQKYLSDLENEIEEN